MSENSRIGTHVTDTLERERGLNNENEEEVNQRQGNDGITAEQDVLLRNLATIFNRIPNSTPAQAPAPRWNPIIEIRKMGAEDFKGVSGVEPNVAEYWLENTGRLMAEARCNAAEKYRCATALLKDEAHRWWKLVIKSNPDTELTWEFFRKEFRNRWVGKLYMSEMKKEFLNLKQGSMSVSKYISEFDRLSGYALELVSTEEDRCDRFLDGLRGDLRTALAPLEFATLSKMAEKAQSVERSKKREEEELVESRSASKRTFEGPNSYVPSKKPKSSFYPNQSDSYQPQRSGPRYGSQQSNNASVVSSKGSRGAPKCEHCKGYHQGKCWGKTGACFRCGSHDHLVRDCPEAPHSAPATVQKPAPTQSGGRGFGRSNQSGGRGSKSSPSTPGQEEVRTAARTYAVRA